MIVDFQARLAAKEAEPKFTVELSLHPRSNKTDRISAFIEIARGGAVVVPETTTIQKDELGFDRQKIEYFRYALLDQLERVQKRDGANLDRIDPAVMKTGETGHFLFAEFGPALENGLSEVTLISQVQKTKFPIPRKFHIFLPEPGSRHPSREDVFSALTPFRRTLREIWQRETDELIAISIEQHLVPPSIILPERTVQ